MLPIWSLFSLCYRFCFYSINSLCLNSLSIEWLFPKNAFNIFALILTIFFVAHDANRIEFLFSSLFILLLAPCPFSLPVLFRLLLLVPFGSQFANSIYGFCGGHCFDTSLTKVWWTKESFDQRNWSSEWQERSVKSIANKMVRNTEEIYISKNLLFFFFLSDLKRYSSQEETFLLILRFLRNREKFLYKKVMQKNCK